MKSCRLVFPLPDRGNDVRKECVVVGFQSANIRNVPDMVDRELEDHQGLLSDLSSFVLREDGIFLRDKNRSNDISRDFEGYFLARLRGRGTCHEFRLS